MRYPHVGDYVTLIISCVEGKEQSGLMFNLKDNSPLKLISFQNKMHFLGFLFFTWKTMSLRDMSKRNAD